MPPCRSGGHGTMWDFPNDSDVGRVGREVYERGGVVAAVCHGPAALVKLTLSDDSFLVAGKRLTAVTNNEAVAPGGATVEPFLLADALVGRGADHSTVDNFQPHVVVDGRPDPASATLTAESVVDVLGTISSARNR